MDDLFGNRYRTKSARLATWDYGSNGKYFVTICADHRKSYFGMIQNSGLITTEIGEAAKLAWESIPDHYPFVALDSWILMPDHLHGILCFSKMGRSGWTPNQFGPQHQNLATVVRGFKMGVTSYARSHSIEFQWQTRFFDRVIRTEKELDLIREYIQDNPGKWPHHVMSPGGV
jgi:putative transposase